MKSHRTGRIAQQIREVASETILFELQDPRIKGVTVTRAEVSGDLQRAKVYVSVMGTPSEIKLCMHGLKSSTGFIQSRLARRLKTRFTPIVELVLDEGVKRSMEMSRLLNEEKKKSALTEQPEDAPESPADGTVEEERVDS